MNISKDKEKMDVYERPRWVHMNDETGAPMYHGGTPTDDDPEGTKTRKPVRWSIYSTLSSRHRRAEEATRGNILVTKGKKASDGATSLQRETKEVAACVGAWEEMYTEENGVEVPLACTPKNVALVMQRFPYTQTQAEGEMADNEAFLSAASAN